MKEQRKGTSSRATEAMSTEWRVPEFPGANLNSFFASQRDAAETVAAAYRKAFEGWARILAVQSDLARSLIQRGASMGAELYRQPGQAGSADTFAEAARAASEDIVRSTREIVDTACECCAGTVKAFGAYANRQKPATGDGSTHPPASRALAD